MPGTNRSPIRPRRLWTTSRNRLCLSNGAGVIGLAFGGLFSLTGIMAGYVAIGSAFILLSVLPGPQDEVYANQPFWRSLLAVVAVALLSIGHLSAGSLMLSTLRCTMDGIRKTVTVRSGWLGIRKVVCNLSDFEHVTIFPSTRWVHRISGAPAFDIALASSEGPRLVIGFATQSADLAREAAREVGQFLGLPTG